MAPARLRHESLKVKTQKDDQPDEECMLRHVEEGRRDGRGRRPRKKLTHTQIKNKKNPRNGAVSGVKDVTPSVPLGRVPLPV